jgi:hypothetical protein
MLNPLSNDQLRAVAPSIFAMQPWERMSEKYRFIPTVEVVEAMRENNFFPMKAMQSRTRIEGKGDFTKHLVRFRHADHLRAATVGEELPEIVLVNSHDGSSAYQLMAGIFRLVCSNGMIVQSSDMGSLSVRHSGRDDNLAAQVIEGSYSIINETPKTFARIADYKAINLSLPQQEAFAKAALELKGENAAKTFEPLRLLSARRTADYANPETKERDLWRTMNVVQENMIRGGVRGRSASGRRATSRTVQSVNEDVRINKALWTLTEEMAKIAA